MAAPRIVTRALDVRASAWLSILLVSGCVVLLDALHAFQWRGPYGGLRAAIAVLLAGVGVSALIFSRRIRLSLPDQGLVARALALITGLAVAIYGGLWIWAVVHTAVSGDTQSDGTQNTYKAIVLLGRGQNPYSHNVMIDPGYYFRLLATLATKEHCLAEPLPTDLSSIRTGNWRTATLTSLEAPLPVI